MANPIGEKTRPRVNYTFDETTIAAMKLEKARTGTPMAQIAERAIRAQLGLAPLAPEEDKPNP